MSSSSSSITNNKDNKNLSIDSPQKSNYLDNNDIISNIRDENIMGNEDYEEYINSQIFETYSNKIENYEYSNITSSLKQIYFYPTDLKKAIEDNNTVGPSYNYNYGNNNLSNILNHKNFENSIDYSNLNKSNYYNDNLNITSVRRKLTEKKVECFCVRFDKSDSILAAGYSTGHIVAFDVNSGNYIKYMTMSEYPVTCLRFKHTGSKPVLLAVHSDGKISQWYPNAGKILYNLEEVDNSIMAVDYDIRGVTFATGGSDSTLKIYDDETKTIITKMSSNFDYITHSSRIFSVCFGKNSLYENILVSGGWDNTIKFYDVRRKTIANSLYGPHIIGDSIDLKDHYLLTASSDRQNQIKIWDLRTYKEVEVVNFEPENLISLESSNLNNNKFTGNIERSNIKGLNSKTIINKNNRNTLNTTKKLSNVSINNLSIFKKQSSNLSIHESKTTTKFTCKTNFKENYINNELEDIREETIVLNDNIHNISFDESENKRNKIRSEDNLYAFNKLKKLNTYTSSLNCAQFAKDFNSINTSAKLIPTFACGGLKKNQIRVYSMCNSLYNNKINKIKQSLPLFKLDDLFDCVYSLDYMNCNNNIAFSSGNGCIISIDINQKN